VHNRLWLHALLCVTFVAYGLAPQDVIAGNLADKVAKICTQEEAVPINLTSAETPAYCKCEAAIWEKRGTDTQLRSAMTYMTGDKSHMNGETYSSDDARDFIIAHDGEVRAKCLPS